VAVDLSEFYEKPTQKCVVGRFIDELPEDDRETILAAIEMPDITASASNAPVSAEGRSSV